MGDTIAISGLQINQQILGDADAVPVLMLHGWGAEISLLAPLAERLAPLGYRCYLLDMPGFGVSEDPPIAWTVHDYADFVLAYMDAHHLQRVHLFGHSFGGRLGLILGAEHAARIGGMALADAAGIRPQTPAWKRARLGVYKGVRDGLSAVGLRGLSDSLRGWYNRQYGSTDFQNVSGVMRQTFVNVVNEDLRGYAGRVRVPTLLFWGDADTDTPLWQGQLLEQLIPDAGLVVFPGAGHYSYLEHPLQTARAMHELFKTLTLA